jgi:hypothetical protein
MNSGKKISPSGLGRARRPDPHPLRPSLARRSPSSNLGRTCWLRRRLGCGVRATPGTAACPYKGGGTRGCACPSRRRRPCPASAPPDGATAWSAAAGCLPRFAGPIDHQSKWTPPRAPGCQAARVAPLLIVRSPSECRRTLKSDPAVNVVAGHILVVPAHG